MHQAYGISPTQTRKSFASPNFNTYDIIVPKMPDEAKLGNLSSINGGKKVATFRNIS